MSKQRTHLIRTVNQIFSLLRSYIFVLIALFLIAGCAKPLPYEGLETVNDSLFTGFVSAEKVEKINRYKISITDTAKHLSDRIFTPYTVFDMQTGDINHDGKTDICIGIIKPTPYDPILKKRLFIFQIDRFYIRPLWLSSRLVYPFEAFALKKDPKLGIKVLVLEVTDKTSYCISEYGWQSFGLTRERELIRCTRLTRAKRMLKKLQHSTLPI
jgi:hypothetical protein